MIHLLAHVAAIRENLTPAELVEHAVESGDVRLGSEGQVCVLTGAHTGRAASDKYIVDSADISFQVSWGTSAAKLTQDSFEKLKDLTMLHMSNKVVYIVDFLAGPVSCRLVCEDAWQALFVTNLFGVNPNPRRADLMIVALPSCHADPSQHGTRSSTFIALNVNEGLCLIGGTGYAGEIKKSVFTYLSWLLPAHGILPVHASVTADSSGNNVAVFFGLSGTGKTTLSADVSRRLLGDDEHGWGSRGIFNFEAGCYAKAIRLTPGGEPYIWSACHRFGTVLENVVVKHDRTIDFDDASLTENTRAAYPLSYIFGSFESGMVLDHPKTIVMLTCDAFGVLPSVAKLSKEAAIYHFLSGYTAKVAGTEKGVTEPTATFSRCFGAPFMPRHAHAYADLLMRLIEDHEPRIFLVNTGWSGGPPGVGKRMKLDYTRELIGGILAGELDATPTKKLMPFNLDVPVGIPDEDPRSKWNDPAAYDASAAELSRRFIDNFRKNFVGLNPAIEEAGPRP